MILFCKDSKLQAGITDAAYNCEVLQRIFVIGDVYEDFSSNGIL